MHATIIPMAAALLCMMISAAAAQTHPPLRTDTPPVGRTDPSRFTTVEGAHGGTGTIRYMELLKNEDFESDFLFVHTGVIQPHSSIGEHYHATVDEMYIVFDGAAEFTVNGETSLLPEGSMVLCPGGSSHGIRNPGDDPVRWMNIAVSMKKGRYDAVDYGNDLSRPVMVTPPPFRWIRLDRSLMRPGANAHDGAGTILFRRLWNPGAFTTKWFVVSHAVVPPGSSIGLHQHVTREEVYYLISGHGRLTGNSRTFDVRAGDAVPCRLRGAHGIYNDSAEDIELLVFSCSLEKGRVSGERNLDDDLTGR